VSTVTVQLFASYAETFGGSTLEIPLDAGSTVGDLVRGIRSLPAAYALPETLRVAVNRKFASLDQVVDSRDEVALIPPVAGG
jgi:molybdopterin converting factor subunit 1